MTRAQVRVQGRVQGVGFRYEARSRARSLGLAGWVRNLPDGSVEVAFEGDEERVRSMVEWCRRGPALAEIRSLEVEWIAPEGSDGFGIR